MSRASTPWLLTCGLAGMLLVLVLLLDEPGGPDTPTPDVGPSVVPTPDGPGAVALDSTDAPSPLADVPTEERTPEPLEVELEEAQATVWTVERMDATARSHMQLDDRRRELVLRPFGPWISQLGREAAGQVLGHELTEAWYAELQAVEAPFNADLDALGQLHADDLDRALRDTWDRGRYHVEQKTSDSELRHPERGESRVAFPDRAYYYRLQVDDAPHLAEQRDALKGLKDARSSAIRLRLRELIDSEG